jgi:predicted Zn-dependent protease
MDQMGVQAYEKIKKETKIDTDPKINAYVRCIADDLLKVVQEEGSKTTWEVTVFVDETANAFALPGGKIGVNTGMLKMATTQDELAAVLGHEIAHVIAKHSNERASTKLATGLGINIAAATTGSRGAQVAAALGAGAYFGIELPFSRTQESEADVLGLIYMSKAGFDPLSSVKLWEKMQAEKGKSPPEFLLTHPTSETRIKRLEEKMPEALELYHEALKKGIKPACKH